MFHITCQYISDKTFTVVRVITGRADVLRVLYDKVSSKINAQSVAREMYQCDALTLKELQCIQSKHQEPVIAAEQLLNIVMNQSDNVYSCFLDALKATGHQHVFEVIITGSYKGRPMYTIGGVCLSSDFSTLCWF